jgi:hypothetical protein
MLKILIIVVCLFTLNVCVLGQNETTASQKENQVTYGISTDIFNKYIFRGYNLSEGNVIQPSGWISLKNFTFTFWSNIDLQNHLNKPKCNEIDVVLTYAYTLQNLIFEPAFQFYFYPDTEESPTTGETILSLSYNLNDFNIATSHSLDFIEYKGSYYADASFGFEHWFNDNSGINAQAGIGWGNPVFNETYIGIRESSIIAFLNLSYTQYTYGSLFIKPKLEISKILNKEIEEFKELKHPYLNIGLSLGIDF